MAVHDDYNVKTQLSRHVQTFIAITLLYLGWEQNEMEKSFVKWTPVAPFTNMV